MVWQPIRLVNQWDEEFRVVPARKSFVLNKEPPSTRAAVKAFFDESAAQRWKWRRRNRFYYRTLEKYFSFLIPEKSRVLEIGCGTGELLNAVKPSRGIGIDFSDNMIAIAKKKFPHLCFEIQNAETLELDEKFDYIILSDLVDSLWDISRTFERLKQVSHGKTRIIISYYNYLWEPVLKLAEKMGLKMRQPIHNWLHPRDIDNLLDLAGFERIKVLRKILFPKNIPGLHIILNTILANLPLINKLCLTYLIVARLRLETSRHHSVSLIIPARNEKGNIEDIILRTPRFGKDREFIFVEGHSSDGTYEEITRIQKKYREHSIQLLKQSGVGKGNAVREGFEKARGEILMILDADLSVPPEDLLKFYDALRFNRGEFINGSRLIYQMEGQAMRLLNVLGNKFFAMLFGFLLGHRIKDTLCGTKVLFKSEYEKIKRNRHYFGDFDPFGDFDLIFGSAKLNLKMVEVPIRYRQRTYGSTQINRFSHGWLLLKMSIIAARKLKFF